MPLNIICHSVNIIINIFSSVFINCAMSPSEMTTMRSLMKRYHGTTMVYHGEQQYTMVNSGITW